MSEHDNNNSGRDEETGYVELHPNVTVATYVPLYFLLLSAYTGAIFALLNALDIRENVSANQATAYWLYGFAVAFIIVAMRTSDKLRFVKRVLKRRHAAQQ